MEPSDEAESFSAPLNRCPACGGPVRDYNAETVIIDPETMWRAAQDRSLIKILYVCHECGGKFFAPPGP